MHNLYELSLYAANAPNQAEFDRRMKDLEMAIDRHERMIAPLVRFFKKYIFNA